MQSSEIFRKVDKARGRLSYPKPNCPLIWGEAEGQVRMHRRWERARNIGERTKLFSRKGDRTRNQRRKSGAGGGDRKVLFRYNVRVEEMSK
eukprot:764135-Hanusia_phi.AAC.3